MDGVVAVDGVEGGEGGVPMSGDDEDGLGLELQHLGAPRLQELPRRHALVDRHHRRSVRYEESVHLRSRERETEVAERSGQWSK